MCLIYAWGGRGAGVGGSARQPPVPAAGPSSRRPASLGPPQLRSSAASGPPKPPARSRRASEAAGCGFGQLAGRRRQAAGEGGSASSPPTTKKVAVGPNFRATQADSYFSPFRIICL